MLFSINTCIQKPKGEYSIDLVAGLFESVAASSTGEVDPIDILIEAYACYSSGNSDSIVSCSFLLFV